MLSEVHIHNLALIEKLSMSFSNGLSVLTGETGAGKSIILQAIHLLSGGKASSSWVRSGTDNAVVEALFELKADLHQHLIEKLDSQGFECDGTIIIKRVLSNQGRSRFYVNGSLSTARFISELSEHLLSVASQHDHQQLLNTRYHLDFIDALGNLWQQRLLFSKQYDIWQEKRSEYDSLQKKEIEKEQRKDFLAFQVQEIHLAKVVEGEDAQLNQEKIRLKASDDLIRLGQKSYSLFYSATEPFAQLRKNMEQMAEIDTTLLPVSEDVVGFTFQLEEQLINFKDYLQALPRDLNELEGVMARLDVLQQLKRKYGPELVDVIRHGESAAKELAELEMLDKRLDALGKEVNILENDLIKSAADLSEKRRKTSQSLSHIVKEELHSLCLDKALFNITFKQEDRLVSSLTRTGFDRPEFMFSANPGEAAKPLAQIASGGELSRMLLALKCLLARKDKVETVIFDEVDAGISGKAAEAVARKIKELASHHQVICITHLPQIASRAEDHYRVSKSVINERTQSSIVHLDAEQRLMELASMLDGDSVTHETLAYVTDLMSRNQ